MDLFRGAGGFGVVFRARERGTGRFLAVKFPQLAYMTTGGELTAFANEVLAAKEIRHPNVVEVLHVNADTTQGIPYKD